MGKTDTIKEKEAHDQAFREFMARLDAESKVEEDKLVAQVQESIKRHYEGNKWDNARLFGDRRSDYQNYSDWGLQRVNDIINSIGKALSSGDYPSSVVPGSDDAAPSTVDKAKQFMGAFAGDYSLIIARVQALLTGTLSQFSVKSDATRKSELRDLPLSGGLHLFFASSGKVYKEESFFSNQLIGSFQIVFETWMSVDEARTIGLQQILATTEQELVILSDLIISLRLQQAESLKKIMKENIKDYATTKAAYDLAIDDTKADQAKVFEQYTKYKTVTDTVDRLYAQLDLADWGQQAGDELLRVEDLFTPWEAELAKRYITEKVAQ